jgi:hypothetical protein
MKLHPLRDQISKIEHNIWKMFKWDLAQSVQPNQSGPSPGCFHAKHLKGKPKNQSQDKMPCICLLIPIDM